MAKKFTLIITTFLLILSGCGSDKIANDSNTKTKEDSSVNDKASTNDDAPTNNEDSTNDDVPTNDDVSTNDETSTNDIQTDQFGREISEEAINQSKYNITNKSASTPLGNKIINNETEARNQLAKEEFNNSDDIAYNSMGKGINQVSGNTVYKFEVIIKSAQAQGGSGSAGFFEVQEDGTYYYTDNNESYFDKQSADEDTITAHNILLNKLLQVYPQFDQYKYDFNIEAVNDSTYQITLAIRDNVNATDEDLNFVGTYLVNINGNIENYPDTITID